MRILSNLKVKARLVVGVLGIVALTLACTACAPQAAQQDSSSSKEKGGLQISFSMNSDCVACHKTPMKSESSSEGLPNAHTSRNGVACITCHSSELDLTEAHAGIDAQTPEPTRLKKAKISDEICLSCHGSYQELAQKTAGNTTLTDVNGLTVNPHDAKQLNEEHAEDVTCQKCHGEHKEKSDKDMQSYCFNCHHLKVYECNTCHEYHT